MMCSVGEAFGHAVALKPLPLARQWRALVLPCMLAIGLTLQPGEATAEADSPPLEIVVRGNRVTLTARAVPLRDVLAALGRKAGVTIHIEESPDRAIAAEPVTVAIQDLSVEESLRRLLASRNHTVIFSAGRVDEVWVLPDGAPLPRPPPGAPVKAASDEEAPDPHLVPRLIREALGKPTPGERVRALDLLTEHADPSTLRDVAITVLRQETDGGVRDRAYELLEEGSAELPTEPLLDLAGIERDPARRIRALEMLADRGAGDPRVENLLREIAADPRQRDLHETARGLLGSPSADPGQCLAGGCTR